MAAKGWTTQVAAAAGVAAATGAAQLGLGYGLGVVEWPATPGADDGVWLGSLGWATWIAASSTVFGAIIAAALRAARPSGPLRAALAFFAGVGALLTVALVALPARLAEVRPESTDPGRTAAFYALVGIVFGVLIAYWAVISRPVAANLIATSAYLWALAATAIVVELTAGRPAATYLTSWQFAKIAEDSRYGTIYWPSALITLAAAFLLGVLAAWPAARRGNHGVGTAASGAVGPVLVGAAFLLLAPQLTSAIGQLQSAYLIAPYAVLAGLAGSALVATLAQRRPAPAPALPSPDDEDDWSEAIDRRPGTRRPRPTEPAAPTKPPTPTRPAASNRANTPAASARPAAAPAEPPSRTTQPAARTEPPSRQAEPTRRDQDAATKPAEPPAPERRPARGGLFGRRRSDPEPQPATDPAPSTGPAPSTDRPSSTSSAAGSSSTSSTDGSSSGADEPTVDLAKPAAQPPAAKPAAAKPTASNEPTTPAPSPRKAAKAPANKPATDPFKPSATTRPRKGATARKQPEPDKPETPPRRSTVAAPPPSPPIAQINPPRDPDGK